MSWPKRRILWLGFGAVLAPLLCLLVLQYRWLSTLEKSSAIAREATLQNYLDAVTGEVEYYYRWIGERSLNLPAELFTESWHDKALYSFKKREAPGVRHLFLVSFVNGKGEALYWDPAGHRPARLPWGAEARAVYAATASWEILAHKGVRLEQASLSVDERDPANRILMNPIVDDDLRVVGLAGLVVDESYFRTHVLQKAVEKAVPGVFEGDSAERPEVAVWDARGKHVLASCPDLTQEDVDRLRRFSFLFTDWRVGIQRPEVTPSKWAKTNFLFNLSVSLALTLATLGGIVVALRAASREMKLSEMKSDFVSNVSHELRTPLASIRVFGELMRLGRVESDDKVREYGEFIETESRRLTQLINNILDFSKIESGRKEYRFEPTDVVELVEQVIAAFDVRLQQLGFRLAFERPAEPLPPARLDSQAVALSLSNLIDNAIKYSQDRKEIRVAIERQSASVVLSVQDFGIGIPRLEQEKIFDRFHRVSTGLVHDVRGSGLGLAIVRHIVDAHGGRVTVQSRRGAGSTFSIHLPLAGGEPGTVWSGEAEQPAET